MTNILAIIPARGGSKRIPHKNIQNFLGKPIISYSIEAAFASKLFNEVMVSTDDIEVGEIAKRYGAIVPFFRSRRNSDDHATTSDVIIEVLNEYKKQGTEYDHICCIYPTAPFVNPLKLIDSYQILVKNNADSVIPVVRYSYPIQRSFRIKDQGKLEYIWSENVNKRSQDFEESFHDAGQFYWINEKSFIRKKNIVTNNTFPYLIPEFEAQDIDNHEDWIIAEKKYLLNKTKNTN